MVEPAQIEADLLAFVQREVFSADAGVTLETELVPAGFDSMSLVRVLVFIEQNYGLWIPPGEITGDSLQNLRALAGIASRLLHARQP